MLARRNVWIEKHLIVGVSMIEGLTMNLSERLEQCRSTVEIL